MELTVRRSTPRTTAAIRPLLATGQSRRAHVSAASTREERRADSGQRELRPVGVEDAAGFALEGRSTPNDEVVSREADACTRG